MSNYCYQVNIAGAEWKIQFPYEIEIDEKCRPFVSQADHVDFRVSFQIGNPCYTDETLVRDCAPRVWKGTDYYRVERSYMKPGVPGSGVCLYMKNPYLIKGEIYPGYENQVNTLEKALDLMEMEVSLANIRAICLHSSVIQHHGKAILFSAPSGTGKSTQAKLWEKWRGAEQLNGDRGIIRYLNSQWIAYGSPFAGTSGIYKNKSAPIKAIVILRQARNNTVRRLSSSEAFRELYSETVIPRWSSASHMQIIDILTEISTTVPVCLLECTPDKKAVDSLSYYLQEEIS